MTDNLRLNLVFVQCSTRAIHDTYVLTAIFKKMKIHLKSFARVFHLEKFNHISYPKSISFTKRESLEIKHSRIYKQCYKYSPQEIGNRFDRTLTCGRNRA